MPYIHPAHRKAMEENGSPPMAVGELNYAFTTIIDGWLRREGVSYATFNGAIGALECAKLELYRRLASPYEDAKIAQHGDVFSESVLSQVKQS